MKQQEETSEPTKISSKESSQCEECKSEPWKYKCPGCSVRSCSLVCIKAHKQRTRCTGQRQKTQFVPLSQFDDNLLLSDYNLLEEVKRVAESAQRIRHKMCGYHHFKLPFHLRSLKSAAGHRRTKLLFLPSGMSRRERNQSRYDQRKKVVSWTIEWRFHSTDLVLLDHCVNENMTVGSIIENHLKPGPWNHRLRQFCEEELDCLKFFIRKYPKGPRSPFHELDIRAPIRQQLANLVLLEYPVIYVFLPSQSYDFEVVKNANPHPLKPDHKDNISSTHSSPQSIPFKEEEIEEDGTPYDPRVLDLFKQVKPGHLVQLPHQSRNVKKINNSSDGSSVAKVGPGIKLMPDYDIGMHVADSSNNSGGSNSKKLDFSEDMDFEFDQGLIDAYSDIIAEINPDDFLDLEGGFAKEMDAEDTLDFGAVFPVEEELEEGEIQEF